MAKKKTKAEALLDAIVEIKPGKALSLTMYDGNSILDAKTIEDRVTIFFKTGELMPIPLSTALGLDILEVYTEYNEEQNSYKIVIEGVVRKLKERKSL